MNDLYDQLLDTVSDPHPYGDYFMMCCPFHGDKKPSMRVTQRGFTCLSCGKYGSLQALMSKVRGTVQVVDHQERVYPNWRYWTHNYTVPVDNLAHDCHSFLKANRSLIKYLRDRKINSQMADAMIGYREGFYTFPIFNPLGNVVSMVARAGKGSQQYTDMRYFNFPGHKGMIYSTTWELIESSTLIYFVFGIIDMLTLASIGLPVMTWTTGKSVDADALLEYRKQVFIIPDKGEEKDAARLAVNLGWRGKVINFPYPDGCKDLNDMSMANVDLLPLIQNFQNDKHKFYLQGVR